MKRFTDNPIRLPNNPAVIFPKLPLGTQITASFALPIVDIYFKNESLKDKRFAGIIFRDEELNFAIEVIERVSNVHFTREGETIYIEDKHE